MITDPIVEQLHKQREEYMERFQYDFDAIIRDIRTREASSPTPLVDPPTALPPKAAAHRTRFVRR
jgi:hypothetical protein